MGMLEEEFDNVVIAVVVVVAVDEDAPPDVAADVAVVLEVGWVSYNAPG